MPTKKAKKTNTSDLEKRLGRTYRRYLPSDNDARIVVAGLLQMIQDDLAKGNDVNLVHLGTLSVQERDSRPSNFGKDNPKHQAGKKVKQVTFRDGAALKRRLND